MCNDAVPEEDGATFIRKESSFSLIEFVQDEDPKELRKGVSKGASDAAPQQVGFRFHRIRLRNLVVDQRAMLSVGRLSDNRGSPGLLNGRDVEVAIGVRPFLFLFVGHDRSS